MSRTTRNSQHTVEVPDHPLEPMEPESTTINEMVDDDDSSLPTGVIADNAFSGIATVEPQPRITFNVPLSVTAQPQTTVPLVQLAPSSGPAAAALIGLQPPGSLAPAPRPCPGPVSQDPHRLPSLCLADHRTLAYSWNVDSFVPYWFS
eukprot:754909-Hanusia_phi.AAC.1